MPVLSNPRWEMFAVGVAKGLSQTDAYAEAGYQKSRIAAAKLAAKPNVKARIEELTERATQVAEIKVIANKAWIMQQLTEMTIEARRDKQYSAARGCVELLGRELGMFVERRDIHIDAYAGLSDKQLVAAALKEIKLLVHEDTDDAIEGEYEEVGGDE